MLNYDYVSLSPEQVQARRIHLDRTGTQAYLTPIIILLTVYVYRRILSPLTSTEHVANTKPNTLQLYTRRVQWLLGNTVIPEFGPLNVQLIGIAYATYLLYLIFQGTGNDYMHITKAFGHVAVSQLPLHYLLSIKSPVSPITIATGLIHERLNAYHRLFGRIVHSLLATHAVLYLRYFVKLDLLAKRIKDWDVRYGLMAFWSLNILALLAIPPVRRKVYHKVFYRSHVVLSAVFAIVVWLHVPYSRKYIGQAGAFWLLNGYSRRSQTYSSAVQLNCKSVGGSLIEVTATTENNNWDNWLPGMHGYLNQAAFGPRTPFTVVDVSNNIKRSSTTIKLIVRNLAGPTTGLLGQAAKTKQKLSLELEGPYGEAQIYMPKLLDPQENQFSNKTLIVAGGVGATYALPIYTALLNSRIKNKTITTTNESLKFIWIVQTPADALWGLDILRRTAQQKSEINVDLFLTKPSTSVVNDPIPGLRIHNESSRPNLATIVDPFFTAALVSSSSRSTDRTFDPAITVLVCGPPSLSTNLRAAVGKHVRQDGRKVNWFEEQFGFGGS